MLIEIRAAQVIQVGITEDPRQLVPRGLWDARGLDHVTDQFDLLVCETETGQVLADDPAAHVLVVQVLFGEPDIVVQGRDLQ